MTDLLEARGWQIVNETLSQLATKYGAEAMASQSDEDQAVYTVAASVFALLAGYANGQAHHVAATSADAIPGTPLD